MVYKRIQALFHPERYHGWGKSRKYFEGWYYKVLPVGEDAAYAFIPGIAMDENGHKHAFIQILDVKNQTAKYIRFPLDSFKSQSDKFRVEIADNLFTSQRMVLNLDGVKGELDFHDTVPWPNRWYSPGIMGPYAFVPFMECYHGVLSMDHRIEGALKVKGKTIDFTDGRGYLEKDWGHSFPEAYTWMQSNHFSEPGISFKASVAKIPWLGSSFTGFIAGLYFNSKLIPFTTYNSTKLTHSFIDRKTVELTMENRKYRIEVVAQRQYATELASPISGFMDGRISESMTSSVFVKLMDIKSGHILFEDTGRNAALEVAGKIEEIIVLN